MPRKPLSACAIALLLLGGCAQSSTLTPSLSAETADTPVGTASLSQYHARPIPFTVYDLYSTWHPKPGLDPDGTQADGSVYLVYEPGYPPLGKGSVQFNLDPQGGIQTIATKVYDGIPLASITSLCYSTFVQNSNGSGTAPFITLQLDLDGDGDIDDKLTFEPIYQTGTYGHIFNPGEPIPSQGHGAPNPVGQHEWQKWNALVGGWWADSDQNFGPPLETIHEYVVHHPGVRLANMPISKEYKGAFVLAAGGGGSNWEGNWVGNVDALKVETRAKWPPAILWDFEK